MVAAERPSTTGVNIVASLIPYIIPDIEIERLAQADCCVLEVLYTLTERGR